MRGSSRLQPDRAGPSSQDSFVQIAGRAESGEQFGDLFRSPGFHRDVDGRFSQIDSVVGTVIGRFHDVGAMVCKNSSQPMQGAGVVGKVDSQAHQAAVFYQTALDDAGEQGHVDVATADQYGNLLSGHLNLVVDRGGDGVGNFFFVHGDDLVYIFLHQGQSAVAGPAHRDAVRDGCGRGNGYRFTLSHRRLHRRKPAGLHANDLNFRICLLNRTGNAADQATTTYGDDNSFNFRMLLQHFQAEGSLPRDDRVIVERMDESQMLLVPAANGFFAGLVVIGAMENDFGAVGFGRGN